MRPEAEISAEQVLATLKDFDEGNYCAGCISKSAGLTKEATQSVLDVLAGVRKVTRVGSQIGETTIGLACSRCYANSVGYSYNGGLIETVFRAFRGLYKTQPRV